jgi:3-deoxy-D-manno-octulosonate 8-phosphate phosphatase (KDO 8-P phosphatase)
MSISTQALNAKLARIKILLTDVDGVLTDATIYIGMEGEIKCFSIQDGLGLNLLQKGGIKVGWISNRPSVPTQRRAQELKMDFLSQGTGSKVVAAEEILAKTGFTFDEVCYVGDDLVDLALLRRAGVAVAVANGVEEVKAVADYVTTAQGGHGAIREIAEMILKAQNKWGAVLERYSE